MLLRLLRDKSNLKELFLFLFFLFVSAFFWVLQSLDEEAEKEFSVGIQLVGVPDDVVITGELPPTVGAVVGDKGTQLLTYWRKGMKPIVLDFADLEPRAHSGRVVIAQTEIEKLLQATLPATTHIVSISADTLELFYNYGVRKTVPVVVDATVETAEDYFLLSLKPQPAKVEVCAPQYILDTLTAVHTKPLTLTNVSEDKQLSLALSPVRGARLAQQEVKLSVQVDVLTEKSVEVPIVTTNFPAGKTLRLFPAEAQVTYTAGYIAGRNITKEDFVITLTYEQVLQSQKEGKRMLPLSLKHMPEGVTRVRIEPSEVDYLVETPDND